MSRISYIVPRSNVFTLEDGTWVIQRSIDRVQELLTGKVHSLSSMDVTYEVTDTELDILLAQGIVEQYDDFFLWLTEELSDTTLADNPFGSTTHYYVVTDLEAAQIAEVEAKFASTGLSDRYEVSERFGKVVIMGLYEEPFSRFSQAEDAQILLAPTLGMALEVKALRFDTSEIRPIWYQQTPEKNLFDPLIRRLEPTIKSKTVVCIDDDVVTSEVVGQVCEEMGAKVFYADSGKDGMTLIQDADPSLIIMDLTLPDLHGYEVVAFVRQNPELAHIPIIIISTLETETDQALAYTVAGAIDYVIKPIKPNDIRRQVWRVLNQFFYL